MSDWNLIQTLLVAIPALPLAAAIITATLGPRLKGLSHWPTVLALTVATILSAMLLFAVRDAATSQPTADADTSAESGETQAATDTEQAGVGFEELVELWTWVDVPDAGNPSAVDESLVLDRPAFDIGVVLRADGLTAIMLLMVSLVSTLVAIYAAGYMHGDRGYWRFFAYVSLFVFSMTMLVSVSNFLLLYVFWEAVGVCSYLLIGFWYEKPSAAAAGKKAFLVNRIGDFGFALALFLIWTTYGSLNYHDSINSVGEVSPGVLGQSRLAAAEPAESHTAEHDGEHGSNPVGEEDTSEQEAVTIAGHPLAYVGGTVGTAICLLLLLGACGKSAQFPLHVWLPDAMEGPTPVSALIHAATMVTAGVYMITRCTPLFMVSPEAQLTVAVVGVTTAALGGFIAFTQNDLKRVLAYSTVSQLGFMFLALGTGVLGGIVAGMFHLFTHAFFKALLFLGAGSVMHAMGDVIDIRRFGGLRRLMPITFWTFLIGGLALAGVAPLAGFWSKDAILHAVHEVAHDGGPYQILYFIAKVTAVATAIYTFRVIFLTFFGEERVPHEAAGHAHESPPSMTIPLMILAGCAVFVGFLHAPFAALLETTPSLAYPGVAGEAFVFLDAQAVFLGTALALAGIGIAAFIYIGDRREADVLARILWPLYQLSRGKMFFDQIYMLLVVWPTKLLAWFSYLIDRFLVDGLVNAVGRAPVVLGGALRGMQTGMVQLYALLMLLGLITLIGTVVWHVSG